MLKPFFALLSFCYLAAFISLLTQARGLFGFDGILPITEESLAAVDDAPSLVHHHKLFGLPPDMMFEAVCLLGAVCALLMLSGFVCLPLCLICWYCYLSLYQVTNVFLNFQWDILLLEVGFAAILAAPFWPRRKLSGDSLSPGTWLMRVVFFKLMFMSGVVKVQADCPTWLGLTALDYHYATQCIPTPLAWWAHQLPPLVQKLSVAATLVIEIPLTFFALLPFRRLRMFNSALQIGLQLLIIATGNYNFFNLLTIALAIACIGDKECAPSNVIPNRSLEELGPIAYFRHSIRSLERKRTVRWLLTFIAFAFTAACSWAMFKVQETGGAVNGVSPPWWHQYSISLAFRPHQLNSWLSDWMLPLVYGIAVGMAVYCTLYFVEQCAKAFDCSRGGVRLLLAPVKVTWALTVVGAILVTTLSSLSALSSVAPSAFRSLPPTFIESYQTTSAYHVASGYGLFRRMTGVGARNVRDEWKQLVSMVARPEIIIEASEDGQTWKEVPFRFKPGALDRTPPFIVPHQPRLDWQMWFAALGEYQHNPWFVALVAKLFQGSEDVIRLLDTHHYPFGRSSSGSFNPPQAIRAMKYSYDFTRADLPWNRRVPGTAIISELEVNSTVGEYPTSTGAHPEASPSQYWYRSFVKEYLPTITKDNASLREAVKNIGTMWLDAPARAKKSKARQLCQWEEYAPHPAADMRIPSTWSEALPWLQIQGTKGLHAVGRSACQASNVVLSIASSQWEPFSIFWPTLIAGIALQVLGNLLCRSSPPISSDVKAVEQAAAAAQRRIKSQDRSGKVATGELSSREAAQTPGKSKKEIGGQKKPEATTGTEGGVTKSLEAAAAPGEEKGKKKRKSEKKKKGTDDNGGWQSARKGKHHANVQLAALAPEQDLVSPGKAEAASSPKQESKEAEGQTKKKGKPKPGEWQSVAPRGKKH